MGALRFRPTSLASVRRSYEAYVLILFPQATVSVALE